MNFSCREKKVTRQEGRGKENLATNRKCYNQVGKSSCTHIEPTSMKTSTSHPRACYLSPLLMHSQPPEIYSHTLYFKIVTNL